MAALAEKPVSSLSTHMGSSQSFVALVQGYPNPPLTYRCTCRPKSHIHELIEFLKMKKTVLL